MNKTLRVSNEGIIKMSLSFSLLLYAFIISIIKKDGYIFIPMLCSTIGDLLIMSSRGVFDNRKQKSFEGGVVAFTLAHLSYLYLMQTATFKDNLFKSAGVWAIALIIMYVFPNIRKTKLFLGVYAIILITNLINAFAYSELAAIGGILFVASDLSLAIFEEKASKWQILIWAAYVPAQICLLTSLLMA